MGENAGKDWEWHNKEIGIGYAAKGVVRQPQSHPKVSQIVDMTKANHLQEISIEKTDKSKKKSHKHEKKRKHDSKESNSSKRRSKEITFNPMLQLLAAQLSDTTRVFQIAD
jgi:hypothetical protein